MTAPAGQDKGRWWTEALASTSFPAVTALVFFHADKERDWRLDSSPTALAGLRAGLAAATATPTPTTTPPKKPRPPKRLQALTRPQVGGIPKVGRTLRALPGRWTPTPGRYLYTWRSDGRTLQTSAQPTFRVPARLAGKQVRVWVRALRTGHDAGLAASLLVRVAAR